MKIKDLCRQAIVAALYVTLTLVFSAISFGAVQCRLSSCLHQLVAYRKSYAVGLVLGVVAANAFSPLGYMDIAAGLLVALFGYGMAWLVNSKLTSKIAQKIVVGITVTAATCFVAAELVILYGLPFWMTWLTVAAGQAITQIIAIPLFSAIDRVIGL